jgi:hypothetical protein
VKVTAETQSLVWDGDDLVDVVGGGRRWGPDGMEQSGPVVRRFPFDRSVAPRPAATPLSMPSVG